MQAPQPNLIHGQVAIIDPPGPLTYAFGPFVIATNDRLLKREGELVALPPKVIDTLLVLVASAGQLVTKEQLLDAVWGSTFVDPNSISQNILRLRKTLDPDLPSGAIVTVPKRGFRFVAEVSTSRTAEPTAPAPTAPALVVPVSTMRTAPLPVPPQALPEPDESVLLTPRAPQRSYAWVALCLAFVIVLGAVVAGLHFRKRSTLPAPVPTPAAHRPAVAILGFDDLAGASADAKNDWIGIALQETLYSELGADTGIRMIPNGAVETMRKDLALGRTTTLPAETVAEICKDLGCDLLVVGRFLVSDGQIRVDIALQDAKTAETLGAFSRTDRLERLLPVIAASGQALRTRLGMSRLSEQQQTGLLAEGARQPEALRAYAEGMVRLRALDAAGARPFFEQAIQIEPDYPLAHSGLSTAWAMLGYDDNAAKEAGKAFDLSGNLSSEERLQVEAQYATSSAKWSEAVAAERALVKAFPDDLRYGLALAAALDAAGKSQDALAVIAGLRKLPEPSGSDPRIALAETRAFVSLGDLTHALPAARAAVARARELHEQFVLAESLLAQGDVLDRQGQHANARTLFAEARQLAASVADPGLQISVLQRDAEALRQMGDLKGSRAELNEALAMSKKIGDRKHSPAASTS